MRVLRALDDFMFAMYRRDWGAQPWAGAIYLVMMFGAMLACMVPFLLIIAWLAIHP